MESSSSYIIHIANNDTSYKLLIYAYSSPLRFTRILARPHSHLLFSKHRLMQCTNSFIYLLCYVCLIVLLSSSFGTQIICLLRCGGVLYINAWFPRFLTVTKLFILEHIKVHLELKKCLFDIMKFQKRIDTTHQNRTHI